MRILFMGTPEIAVRCLDALVQEHEVVCVATQPDRPKGRGHRLAFPPVKERALELGLDVVQPTALKDGAFLEVLERYAPEVIAVVAYGRILPKYILEYPKYGCINVHASLLPKYRGAAPIQRAVLNGEAVSGVTTMRMDEGLDTGDMLLRREIPIPEMMTGGELYEQMCTVGSALLLETLARIDEIRPAPQTGDGSYAPMLTKADTVIQWNRPAREILNLIRGLNPLPAARTTENGRILKVYAARAGTLQGAPGTVLATDGGLTVGCADGSVVLTEVQPEGKRRMSAEDFLRGNKTEVGAMLG